MRFGRNKIVSEYPMDVSVVIDSDVQIEDVLPEILEAGLNDPNAVERFNLVYGRVDSEDAHNRVISCAGVFAVQQVTNFKPA